MANQVHLAADLGASSGRVVAGLFDGRRLQLDELHRFENGAVHAAGRLHWDVLRLWNQISHGLQKAASSYARQVQSVGVDTWGVDFALIGRDGTLLANPVTYRDARTNGMLELAESLVPRAEMFRQTGLQFLSINTLFQLLALRTARSPLLDVAERLLLMPDLFHWLLTGELSNEATNASTTQFFNPTERRWANELLTSLDLPSHLLGSISPPGTRLGRLTAQVAADTGLGDVEVVLPGSHDTASAVMAVPTSAVVRERPTWCYISSGTWSLMGVELPHPVVTDDCLRLGFTNEGGVGGTIRLLKNITGLWLLQECRRIWARQGKSLAWDEISRLGRAAPAWRRFVYPDDASLLAPPDMPAAIRAYWQRTGQAESDDLGALVRCATESLALRYRQVLGALEQMTGGRLETIHIVGGGVQNHDLCQATADACQRVVVAGPIEATAIGNIMAQALAAGAVGSIAEAREIVRRSFPTEQYEPRPAPDCDALYARYLAAVSA